MSGPELAVVVLAALSCLAVVGVVLLVQVRTLRREVRPEVPAERTRELQVAAGRESDGAVRILPRVATDSSLSVERAPSNEEVVRATLGHPLVRAAAVAHGVRCALTPENRDRIRALVRRDIRRRQKLRMRAARRAARVLPIDPGLRGDHG